MASEQLCGPVRIGHLYGAIGRCGGVERVLERLTSLLDEDEIYQELLLLRRYPSAAEMPMSSAIRISPRRVDDEKITHIYRRFPVARRIGEHVGLLWRLATATVDVIHIHRGGIRAHHAAVILSRLRGKKVVRTLHRDPRLDGAAKGLNWLCSQAVHRWVVLAPEHAASLANAGIARDRITVIPNGVATSGTPVSSRSSAVASLALPPNASICLCVSRLDEAEKDFNTLLNAFARVRKDRELVLLIAGEGPARGSIECQIAALGIADSVYLLGFRTDVRSLMGAASMLVLSTFHEGLPLVLAEAMSVGTPVIASDVPGVRYMLNYGKAGMLVPPRDADALAAAIDRFVSCHETRTQYSEYGRAWVNANFSDGMMVDRYRQVWYQSLSGTPQSLATNIGL
jgi:glycosyltransferase involved in cell wall biosynthesis